MKIVWNDTFEVEIIDHFDEETNNIAESHKAIIKAGVFDFIDIIKDDGNYVDMQFGNGSMAYCILKTSFKILEK